MPGIEMSGIDKTNLMGREDKLGPWKPQQALMLKRQG
jgi:hypothetical protein